jgi:threonine dehydratase
VSNDDVAAAWERIRPRVPRTPTMAAGGLRNRPVALKDEHPQHTGRHEVRCASETLLTSEVPSAGVVAASGGNHGAAVAHAAAALGHRAAAFVPEISGPAKIALILDAGAAALAGPTSAACPPRPGERVAVLLCGANPAPDPLASRPARG